MSTHRNRLLARVTAPVSEPVSLAEAKLYLRVDGSAEDTLIADLIVAARLSAEDYLRSSLITQSWKLAHDDYIQERIALAMGPVSSISSITMVARDGTTQVVSANAYYLNAAGDGVMVDNVVFGNRVDIVYVTGYGDSTKVPTPIKLGMLAHIAAMYDARGVGESALPAQSIAFYAPFRRIYL